MREALARDGWRGVREWRVLREARVAAAQAAEQAADEQKPAEVDWAAGFDARNIGVTSQELVEFGEVMTAAAKQLPGNKAGMDRGEAMVLAGLHGGDPAAMQQGLAEIDRRRRHGLRRPMAGVTGGARSHPRPVAGRAHTSSRSTWPAGSWPVDAERCLTPTANGPAPTTPRPVPRAGMQGTRADASAWQPTGQVARAPPPLAASSQAAARTLPRSPRPDATTPPQTSIAAARLWLAILRTALTDALADDEQGIEAHRWLTGTDHSRGRDFERVADLAGLHPDHLRRRYQALRSSPVARATFYARRQGGGRAKLDRVA